MNKQLLYSLYDNVAEQFGPIFQAANVNVAIRTVQNLKINSPDDFNLYCVGEWDMETGKITTGEKHEILWKPPVTSTKMGLAKVDMV